MGRPLDIAYTLALPLFLPALLSKRREGYHERMGHGARLPDSHRPRVLVHTVSVGETNMAAPLVRTLADGHGADVVVSATTDTGVARAREIHAPHATVVRFPLDFSAAVERFLDRVRPDVVALAELELWPNFAQACARRSIPLTIINGRLSARSFRGYRRARPLLQRSFRSLATCAAQTDEYARRFIRMGVPPDRVVVAGSMKWDSVNLDDPVEGVDEFAQRMGIDRSRPLVVAGSTAPDEHALLHSAVPLGVQLLCAPRRPEWFDRAAADLPGCARWSIENSRTTSDRFLLDAIGQLRRAYALADVVVIGRSFGDLYGSDPMEPAALGKPLLIGPRFSDFTDSVHALESAGALRTVRRETLAAELRALLESPDLRSAMGDAATECVRAHQGATARHAALILDLLPALHEAPSA